MQMMGRMSILGSFFLTPPARNAQKWISFPPSPHFPGRSRLTFLLPRWYVLDQLDQTLDEALQLQADKH